MEKRHREFLLVDGYNIINAWPELSDEVNRINLGSARDKLIDIMADYSAFTGIFVIIVFDAHQVDKNIRTNYTINGVDVVYTKEGETADHYIEKVADAIGREERVRVATSDWIEQQIVMGRGASRISARELYEEVNSLITKRQAMEKSRTELKETLADIIDPGLKERLEKHIKDLQE
ncbi:MAG TPA: NYN domain-containing protein [Thermoanaerobacterales bacterium]|nr:NYN domain-containing protein [Thermoanaerobacterales bacterium]